MPPIRSAGQASPGRFNGKLASAAVATLSFILVVPSTGLASADPGKDSPPVADSTVTLVSGSVAKDRSQSAGIPVLLVKRPSDEVLASMKVGSTVRTPIVARDTTDSVGMFDLRAEPRVASDIGAVNDPTGDEYYVVFPTRPELSRLVTGDAHGGLGVGSPTTLGVLSETPAGQSKFGPTETIAPGIEVASSVITPLAPSVRTNSVNAVSSGVGVGCNVTKIQDLPSRRTRVGQVWSTNSRGKVAFTYSTGSSRAVELGVGFSTNNVGWKANGSVSKYYTATTSYTAVTGATSRGYNKFTSYGKFKTVCVTPTFPTYVSTTYDVSPYAISGSSVTALSQSSVPTGGTCASYYNGRLTVDSGKNTTYSNGVDLAAVININLSAQVGYNSGTKIEISSTNGGSLRICGKNGNPEGSAPGDIIIR